MSDTIWQCCYTNTKSTIGNVLKTGWSEVAVSTGIPADAKDICIGYQVINSRIDRDMESEKAGIPDVFEIFADGSYIYLICSFYGLQDFAGRSNMFSHAYIMSLKNDEIKDPNLFLTISEDNFTDSEDTADAKKNQTGALIKSKEYVLKNCLTELGLNADTYSTLIDCIYVQYTNKRLFKPLYIQYDGNIETMKKLLYCIYMGLPFDIRKNLKAASKEWNNSNRTNLIFSKDASQKNSYIVPETGENNLLGDREKYHLEKIKFIDYAAKNYTDTTDINDYFSKLDELLIPCDDSKSDDEKLYRLSFLMNDFEDITALNNEEIIDYIDIIFENANTKDNRVQGVLADFLQILRKSEDNLYLETEGKLIDLLNKGDIIKVLAESADTYFVYRFSNLSVEKAEKLLDKFSSDDAQVYRKYLKNDEKEDTFSDIQEVQPSCSNEAIADRTKKFIDEIIKDYPELSYDRIREQIQGVFDCIIGEDISEECDVQVNNIEEDKAPETVEKISDDKTDATFSDNNPEASNEEAKKQDDKKKHSAKKEKKWPFRKRK